MTKLPLPIFFIDLKKKTIKKSNANNKEIYKTQHLLQCQVVIEAHPRREIPQCANCQQYGHTKKFCHRRLRCVKFAGDHLTSQCPRKVRSDDVTCVFCNGNHPANYKVALSTNNCRNPDPNPRSKSIPAIVSNQAVRTPMMNKERNKKRNTPATYFQAAQQLSEREPLISSNNVNTQNKNNKKLIKMIKQLTQQLINMTNAMNDLISKLSLLSIN